MKLSNGLSLIEARLLSLEPSNKVHPLFETLVTFDYTFEAHNSSLPIILIIDYAVKHYYVEYKSKGTFLNTAISNQTPCSINFWHMFN